MVKTEQSDLPKCRLVITVRKGMVDSVFCSVGVSVAEIDILDFDSSVPDEIRRNKLREKKAKKVLKQIY